MLRGLLMVVIAAPCSAPPTGRYRTTATDDLLRRTIPADPRPLAPSPAAPEGVPQGTPEFRPAPAPRQRGCKPVPGTPNG
jgi:hypothetical protein